MRTFVETSAFYALLDRGDQNHEAAKRVWAGLLEKAEPSITSNYVLVETFALLQHRLGVAAVRGLQEDLIPVLQVEFVTPEQHRAGVSALLAADRRGLSLVDCVSFEVMRNSGIRTVFGFDPHFKGQGFTVIP
jgi:predicted nucleic acid-binding protein